MTYTITHRRDLASAATPVTGGGSGVVGGGESVRRPPAGRPGDPAASICSRQHVSRALEGSHTVTLATGSDEHFHDRISSARRATNDAVVNAKVAPFEASLTAAAAIARRGQLFSFVPIISAWSRAVEDAGRLPLGRAGGMQAFNGFGGTDGGRIQFS